MLSSAKVGTSSWRYYSNSVAKGACEYYAGAGDAPGQWQGRGLRELGLEPGAMVSEQQLEALFARAIHPSSEEALGRRWRVDGVTGFDLTFSAPKSASVLWALSDPLTRSDVVAAHRAAVHAGLRYLDEHAGLSRRGTDGSEQIRTAGLVAALFPHRTSRAGDPQLHAHALVLNKLKCADGVWRTIDGHELYAHQKSAGAVYQAALRSELSNRLVVAFDDRTPNAQAEIIGVPSALLETFSKRTARIAEEAGPVIAEYERTLGRELSPAERAAVVKTAVLKTRPVKEHTDTATLFERWATEAAALGWDAGRLRWAVDSAGLRPPPPLPAVEAVLDAAIDGAGRRAATFSRADLLVELAARIPVVPGSADGARQQLEQLADSALQRETAVPLGAPPLGAGPRASDARYVSAELLAAEQRVLHRARRAATGAGVVPAGVAEAVAAGHGLDAGQTVAVLGATTGGRAVSVWTAPAGTGKTTALGAAATAWQEAGYRVLGLAPSARAAAELAAATGQPADTLAKWRHEHDRHHQRAAGEDGRWQLTASTVVVVDEAGMASTFDLDALTAAAEHAGARVLLVGDPAQIGVVNGPGGLLAALARRGPASQLEQVHRFTHEWERTSSLQLRDGDPAGLDTYAAQGRIHPAADSDAALTGVLTRWSAERAAGRDALMMARKRADVDALNARARAAALAAGEVYGPAAELRGRTWQTGDLLLARRNDRRLAVGDGSVRNGDRYRVLAADPLGLAVQRLGSEARALLPADYVAWHADYGWASTIDGAQGATTDVGVLLARPGLDREHLYVGMTRGRHANHIHVAPDDEPVGDIYRPLPGPPSVGDARALLARALARSGAQQAATDVRATARQATRGVPRPGRPGAGGPTPGAPEPRLVDSVEEQIAARQQQQTQLRQRLQQVGLSRRQMTVEMVGLRWWERGHRRDLEQQLHTATQEQSSLQARLKDGAAVLDRLHAAAARHADQQEQQRRTAAAEQQQRSRAWQPPRVPNNERPPTPAEHSSRRSAAPKPTTVPPPALTPAPPRRGPRI